MIILQTLKKITSRKTATNLTAKKIQMKRNDIQIKVGKETINELDIGKKSIHIYTE